MFVSDEIDTFLAIRTRSGATVSGMLRSAYTGTMLGFSTKSSNNFHLEDQSYRLTLIVGAQPERVGPLLEDTGSGMPQRFLWFPAIDQRIDHETLLFPAELTLPNRVKSDVWRTGAELQIPADAEWAIKDARVKSGRGQGDPRDSHVLFAREKFAYALAVLDGRDRMNEEDWKLAGIAVEVSDYTRDWMTAASAYAVQEHAAKAGRIKGVEYAAANESRDTWTTQRHNDIRRRVWDGVPVFGGAPVTKT